MIRSALALSSLLLGSLLASPVATGQESPKPASPAGEPTEQAELASRVPLAQVSSTNVIDPFSTVVTYPPGQEMLVRTKLYDDLELNYGLSLSDADDALRAQLEVPPGEGVVIVGVRAGSLAEHAGLKRNDVLLSLGDQKAKSWGQVKQVLLGLDKEAVEVKLIREGKASRMSLVGPKHGFPPEAAEYWIGTPVSPVDATLRTHLPMLPADSGLIVNDVVKGSPADRASVLKNDVLVAMDGKPLKNSDSLIAQIRASRGKPVPLQVLRAGKPLMIGITPAKRVHPTVINTINFKNQPELQRLFQVVRPNMAIEVDPRPSWSAVVQGEPQTKPVESKVSPSGNYTLFAPYAGVVHDPYPDIHSTAPAFTTYLTPYSYRPSPAVTDPSTARIEAQLKEVVEKLEAIAKAVEGLKTSLGK